jgi:hypothetical protein
MRNANQEAIAGAINSIAYANASAVVSMSVILDPEGRDPAGTPL